MRAIPRTLSDRSLWPLSVAGTAVADTFSLDALSKFDFRSYIENCRTMGIGSFPLISLAAVFISFTVTLQVVFVATKYGVEEIAGGVIAAGLLRELGPLTLGVAWAARVAVLFAEEAVCLPEMSDRKFAASFTLPRYAAAVSMAFPLSVYGLVIGFLTATATAAVLGGVPPDIFLEAGRLGVTNKDVMVYFIKLVLINPASAIFAAAIYLRLTQDRSRRVISRTLTAAVIVAYAANATISNLFYAPMNHWQRFPQPDPQFSQPAKSK
ncbi:MAG TPA: ABC transporter permease [Candidatus Saccharimonadales bacterium]